MSGVADTLPQSCSVEGLSSCRFRSQRLTAALDREPDGKRLGVGWVCLTSREASIGLATRSTLR